MLFLYHECKKLMLVMDVGRVSVRWEIRFSSFNFEVAHIFKKTNLPKESQSENIHNTQSLHKPTRKRHEKYLKYEFVESRKTTTEKVCDTRVDVSREYLDDRGGS